MDAQRARAQVAAGQLHKMLSVIIPVANEIDNLFFQRTIENISLLKDIEVICVDKAEAISRAERLNKGFLKSKGDMILFHHPRSLLDLNALQYLIENSQKIIWGAMTHQFDLAHPLLKFTSWYSNHIRGKRRGVFYLDHCIFFHRSLFVKPLPDIDIFEDTVLSKQLLEKQKPILLPFKSTTSAVRFVKNGIYRQALLNQILKIAFAFKLRHDLINKFYEKGLNLNNDPKQRT